MDYINYNMDQVSCIDRQIAELEARRDALLHGYCFTGVHIPNETIIVEDELPNKQGKTK